MSGWAGKHDPVSVGIDAAPVPSVLPLILSLLLLMMSIKHGFTLILLFVAMMPSACVQSAEMQAGRSQAVATTSSSIKVSEKPRNVILFIADGTGPATFTMGRDYLRYKGQAEALVLDPLLVGSVRTYASNSRVTDSAASATAYASGVKTYNGAIGVDSTRRPVATVLEVAEAKGMATGLVSTSRITHATPAAFSAHVPSRAMENEIASQQIAQGIDVLIGGGTSAFLPTALGGRREDGRNLFTEAAAAGYQVVQTREAFDGIEQGPALVLLAESHVAYEVDRDAALEPSIAEMTAKAIDLLNDASDGFFLMVEGSRIDHAAHGNDAAAHLHDLLAYDEAVGVALDFARQNGETLIIATSDHETGGLSLGRNLNGQGVYEWKPEVVDRIESSHGPILGEILTATEGLADSLKVEAAAEVVARLTGIEIGEEETLLLGQALNDSRQLNFALAEIIARHAILGWTTNGHTAVDVPLFAYGPGSDALIGNHDNTYIGRYIAKVLDLDLEAATKAMHRERVAGE